MKKSLLVMMIVLLLSSCAKKNALELKISETKVAQDEAWVISYTLKNKSNREYAVDTSVTLELMDPNTAEWTTSDIELVFFPTALTLANKKSYSAELHGDQIIPRLAKGKYRLRKTVFDGKGNELHIVSEAFTVE